jgi:hypothetical protein
MPQVIVATRTLRAIEDAIRADQGASFREWEKKVLPHLEDAYRGKDDAFRSHMGASSMGGKCGRAIWYSFRWATRPEFDGRRLRLFNRGHLEEGRFIAMLLMIGVQVYQQDGNGKQYRISGSHGHYGGSGDGIGLGIPDLPAGTYAVLEFKTHNDKSYTEVAAKGVRDAKFEHFVQMQQYMRKMGIPAALYCAVNKNNDDIYMEIVPLDSALADQYIERADKIIWMHEAPSKLPNASAGWFECKWCDHRPVCHLNAPPDKNCRTCAYAWPTEAGDGQWVCANPAVVGPGASVPIPKEVQLQGCSHYERKKM